MLKTMFCFDCVCQAPILSLDDRTAFILYETDEI